MAVSTNVKLSTLAYVILYVKDAQKALPFYRDTLGMSVKMDDGDWVELETGATKLCLHSDKNLPATRSAGQAIACFEVQDIFGTYEALKAKGVQFKGEPHTVCEAEGKTGKSADFTDADGNHLSIFGYVK